MKSTYLWRQTWVCSFRSLYSNDIPRFFATIYWKIQHSWFMTRAALHSSLVMHKIQYTTRASHSLCIEFYALLVIRAMQLSSFIIRVVFFNTLRPKILEYHITIFLIGISPTCNLLYILAFVKTNLKKNSSNGVG